MVDSDSSGLSSPPSDIEEPVVARKTLTLNNGRLTAVSVPSTKSKSLTPPESPSRESTPEHEFVFADNPDIPILVAFRARFSNAFPKNVSNFGPQDLERGLVESDPGEQIENFLCALLSLVLNRKKLVERGHHGRALEEAVQTQKHQWPNTWNGMNPLHGARSFQVMNPTSRLSILKTLMLWSLNTSEAITTIIKESYRQARRDDDLNQPLSVQSWGSDGRKRKYWLIEGQNDTSFRLYIENPTKTTECRWWNVAGTLEEVRAVAGNLHIEGSQAAKRLADKIEAALPRLEATEEKRRRREYRLARRAAFRRPDPGFSLYEGRTRGKRMKYTYSDDEDDGRSETSARKPVSKSDSSTIDGSCGPTVTASGRQVKSRFRRPYFSQEGSASPDSSKAESYSDIRARGSVRRDSVNIRSKVDHMSVDEDTESTEIRWEGYEDIEESYSTDQEALIMDESSDIEGAFRKSLVVHLKYPHGATDKEFKSNLRQDLDSSHPNKPTHGDPMSHDPRVRSSIDETGPIIIDMSKAKGAVAHMAKSPELAPLTKSTTLHTS